MHALAQSFLSSADSVELVLIGLALLVIAGYSFVVRNASRVADYD